MANWPDDDFGTIGTNIIRYLTPSDTFYGDSMQYWMDELVGKTIVLPEHRIATSIDDAWLTKEDFINHVWPMFPTEFGKYVEQLDGPLTDEEQS